MGSSRKSRTGEQIRTSEFFPGWIINSKDLKLLPPRMMRPQMETRVQELEWRKFNRLLGLSARMGKGRSWLGSAQDCLRACTNIQFVKYRQSLHKICIRSKNIQFVKRFSFRIVCLRICFG